MNQLKRFIGIIEWEAVIWFTGLVYLFFINPYSVQKFTLCPFHNLGIDFCPGCGLGRSISFFYNGDILSSIHAHPLGIIALIIISFRIKELTIKMYNNFHKTEEVVHGERLRINA